MIIKQPSDFHVAVKNGSLELEWNKKFGKNASCNFKKAQEFIDSECIRKMVPYTPMLSGTLFKSVILETKIGSGEIIQSAPYARYQYYGKLMVSKITGSSYATHGESKVLADKALTYSTSKHKRAGPMWFERMKADHKDSILRGAKRMAGSK